MKILWQMPSFLKLDTTIDDKDNRLIMHCRKYVLFFRNETWKMKSTESYSDVTLDSFDGVEICELVALYSLSKLENIFFKTNFGLNQDDGLILLRNLYGHKMDKKRNNIMKILKDIGFSMDI